MKDKSYSISFITPCFCAGADQTQAEIRVPSIRGQIRWWFRALGGTYAQEKNIFGGIGKKNNTLASKVIFRISNMQRSNDWVPFNMRINHPGAYIWYYATVSHDKKRWYQHGNSKGSPNSKGNIPPGSSFTLHVLEKQNRKERDLQDWNLFDQALESFLTLGSLGMRSTRAMGCFFTEGYENPSDELTETLSKKGFQLKFSPQKQQTWKRALIEAEKWLRYSLRKKYPAEKGQGTANPSPLGFTARAERQTSAVRFRILKTSNEHYQLVIIEAPHCRVLGKPSRTPSPVTALLDLTQTPSPPPPLRQRR